MNEHLEKARRLRNDFEAGEFKGDPHVAGYAFDEYEKAIEAIMQKSAALNEKIDEALSENNEGVKNV